MDFHLAVGPSHEISASGFLCIYILLSYSFPHKDRVYPCPFSVEHVLLAYSPSFGRNLFSLIPVGVYELRLKILQIYWGMTDGRMYKYKDKELIIIVYMR